MKIKEIKSALLEGKNFCNEAANWQSFCVPGENLYWIEINCANEFFENVDKAARRIYQLLKRGY